MNSSRVSGNIEAGLIRSVLALALCFLLQLQSRISRGVLGLDFGSSAVTLRNDEIDVCFEVLVCGCK